jgi:hypothetical protein
MAGRPLIDVATDLQVRARPPGGSIPIPQNTGLETAFGSVGSSLKSIGDNIGKMADKAAKAEGEDEGRQAGLDPEFRTKPDRTLYAEAFNKHGLDVAETRLKTSLESGLEQVWDKHGSNTASLAKGIDDYTKGIVDGAPEELRPKLTLIANAKRMGYMRQAQREQVATARAEQSAAMQEELARSMRGLSQRAFSLGLDAEADKAVDAEIGALQAVLGRKGIDGKPLVAPAQARKLVEGARAEVLQARMLGAFDRLETPEAKARFIAEFEASWKKGDGVAKDLDLDQMISTRRMLEGELRRTEGTRGTGERIVANQIQGFQKLAEQGYAPRPEDLASVQAIVAQSGDPRQAEALAAAEATLRFQQGARRMPPEQIDRYVTEERERLGREGGTLGEKGRLDMAEKLLGEMRRGLKEDPNEWASRVGLVPLVPVDFSSPQNLAKTLQGRIATAEQVGAMYDQDPVYLRPDERRRLVAMAAPGGQALTDVVETITKGAGAKSDAILRELWTSGEGLTLATLGGHAAAVGRTAVAQDVADGVAWSRTKDFKNLAPSANEARDLAVKAHGGALSGLPKSEQALIDATNYAYGVRLQRTGKTDDDDLWVRTFRELAGERSIQGVTYGGVATWRSRSVIIPPDVRQDGFGDLIRSIQPDDFGEGAPRNAKGVASAREIQGATLVPLGSNRFRLNVGDEDTPVWLGDAGGQPFVLDLARLKPKLIERRPELYLDGKGEKRRATYFGGD